MKAVDCPFCGVDDSSPLYRDFQGNQYVRCNQCSLVFQNPRKETEYTKDYWWNSIDPDGKVRNVLEENADKIRNLYLDDIKFIRNTSPDTVKKALLDVGCGLGIFLKTFGVGEWDKYGVDVSNYATDFARKLLIRLPNAEIFTGTLQEAKYESDFFDVVYCYHVIEHIDNPRELVNEIKRITKPDGILMISTPDIDSFCARRFKGNYRLLGTPHIALWSKKTLARLLEENDFKPFKYCYPFFRTKYFTLHNLLRLIDTKKVSPPFYGNIMTIYARKELRNPNY